MSEIITLKHFFSNLQIPISEVWLETCYNWCKTEVLGPRYTPKDLQTQVYEQWLVQDLRDVGISTLPLNLSTKEKFQITGNFCLQMLQIVDISKPKLWQIHKIRNSNALTRGTQQDSDVAGTGKRMLQLTLTDGIQEVEAMEYKIVPSLSLNLAPGCKIRILGPVMVRRGRLMLEPHNVKLLGGDVEELSVCNAVENVLARCLKLPENPNPVPIPEKLFSVDKEEKNEGYVSDFSWKQSEKAAKEKTQQILSKNLEIRTPVSDMPLDDLDDDIFKDIDIDAHLNEVDYKVKKKESIQNVLTIVKIKEMQGHVSKGVFKIHGRFKEVQEKLTVDDEYKLSIQIQDSTGELTVRVHSDVVTTLAETTPQEIKSLRDEYDKQTSTQKIIEVLIRVKERLLKLDNIVQIQIEKDKTPLLIKFL